MKLRSWYLGFTKLERLWLGIQVWMQNSYFGSSRKEIKPEGEQPSPEQRIAAEHGHPREDDVEDGGLPGPPTSARACPDLRVTCGLLQKSLPVSNGLVHILLPVHNLLVQSLERKAIGVTLLRTGPRIPPARDSKESTNGSY